MGLVTLSEISDSPAHIPGTYEDNNIFIRGILYCSDYTTPDLMVSVQYVFPIFKLFVIL